MCVLKVGSGEGGLSKTSAGDVTGAGDVTDAE